MVEIYKERVYDLLAQPDPPTPTATKEGSSFGGRKALRVVPRVATTGGDYELAVTAVREEIVATLAAATIGIESTTALAAAAAAASVKDSRGEAVGAVVSGADETVILREVTDGPTTSASAVNDVKEEERRKRPLDAGRQQRRRKAGKQEPVEMIVQGAVEVSG